MGGRPQEKNVCQRCVEEKYLQKIIRRNLTSQSCDYCQSSARKSAPVECIMSAISNGFYRYFNSYEGAGCPYGRDVPEIPMLSTLSALQQIPLECDWHLLEDVAGAFHNPLWVDAAGGMWMGSHVHDELKWSWNQFADAVKHRTRFHFGISHKNDKNFRSGELIEVSEFLPFLARLIRKHRLSKVLPVGLTLTRVRLREAGDSWDLDAKELGAPSAKLVRAAGRMNPAGISYFYSAFDELTALAEVNAIAGKTAVVSSWETVCELHVVDFTELPPIPSVFDPKNSRNRESILFLTDFLHDIASPIAKDGSEHLEYVPTQVVSEFIAQVFRTNKKRRIDGIIFSSSVKKGGKNLVIFPTDQNRRERFDQIRFMKAIQKNI